MLDPKREDCIMMANGIYVDKQYVLIRKMSVLQGKKLPVASVFLELLLTPVGTFAAPVGYLPCLICSSGSSCVCSW